MCNCCRDNEQKVNDEGMTEGGNTYYISNHRLIMMVLNIHSMSLNNQTEYMSHDIILMIVLTAISKFIFFLMSIKLSLDCSVFSVSDRTLPSSMFVMVRSTSRVFSVKSKYRLSFSEKPVLCIHAELALMCC